MSRIPVTLGHKLRGSLWLIGVVLSAVLMASSFFVRFLSYDTAGVARRTSARLEKRARVMDDYAERLLQRGTQWPELGEVPDDIVLYRYLDDTLNCWYNLFTVSCDERLSVRGIPCMSDDTFGSDSPLAGARPDPSFVNVGRKWYVLKSYEEKDVRVIGGLLINDRSVTSLMDDGSVVSIQGTPVFKIASSLDPGKRADVQTASLLRVIAALLMAVSIMLWAFGSRKTGRCFAALVSISLITLLFRLYERYVSRDIELFSPSLYASDGPVDSLGTLLFFNTAILLSVLCLYNFRYRIASPFKSRPFAAGTFAALVAALAGCLVYYIRKTLESVLLNSDITLDPGKFSYMSNLYTPVVYLSYILLCLSVFLLAEFAAPLVSVLLRRKFTFRNIPYSIVFSLFSAVLIISTVIPGAFTREKDRIGNFCERLAVDHDLVAEARMLDIEGALAADNVLAMMCSTDNTGRIVAKRIKDLYFPFLSSKYDLTVSILGTDTPGDVLRNLDSEINSGTPIEEHSRFVCNFNPSSGARYCAVFTYPMTDGKLNGFFIKMEPRVLQSVMTAISKQRHWTADELPPFYSFARYSEGKLVAFKGNYSYPLLFPDSYKPANGTTSQDGYRHFFNVVGDGELIVVTREERNLLPDCITFFIIVIVLYLLLGLFRIHKTRFPSGNRFFSVRMKRITMASLVSTLVVMTGVSVLFVVEMGSRDKQNRMSSKVSVIQTMLDSYCRDKSSLSELLTAGFAENLSQTARNTQSEILLYTTSGKLFMGSSPSVVDAAEPFTRIRPEAFRRLVLRHERYCIISDKASDVPLSLLYAPVMNASGTILAIACIPYVEANIYLKRDAISHSGMLVSFFLLILFIVSIVVSSVTNAIFLPLHIISRKMLEGDVSGLRPITYTGRDEISALVDSYNSMLLKLRQGAAQMAEAERNKAWSGMARQVAHEIKNPLTPIKLELQRIIRLKQKGDPSWAEKFDKASAVVLEQIDILSETANEFSTFAKLYSEDPVEMDLDQMLKNEILLFEDKGTDITYLGMDSALYNGPKPQLTRVFFNIINNAVQASQGADTPAVLVSLRRGDETSGGKAGWVISVEDNGPGVSEENKDKLFTPNFTTKSGGTGLGLAISRSVVESCSGTISYSRSFTLGGACFTIRL